MQWFRVLTKSELKYFILLEMPSSVFSIFWSIVVVRSSSSGSISSSLVFRLFLFKMLPCPVSSSPSSVCVGGWSKSSPSPSISRSSSPSSPSLSSMSLSPEPDSTLSSVVCICSGCLFNFVSVRGSLFLLLVGWYPPLPMLLDLCPTLPTFHRVKPRKMTCGF